MLSVLDKSERIKLAVKNFVNAKSALFLGRGSSFPIAMEGALKLKEISYIHAEGYASGEMKHGPIALVDDKVPVVVIAPKDFLFKKNISNMQEIMARGGKVLLITDENGDKNTKEIKINKIVLPNVNESSISRESDYSLSIAAGPEIGVASTKAFSAQLCVLGCLCLVMARNKKKITKVEEFSLTESLLELH